MNILRILQIWLFHDTMIVHDSSKSKIECTGGGISVELDGPPIQRNHLLQILDESDTLLQLRTVEKLYNKGVLIQSTSKKIEGAGLMVLI